MFQRVEIEDQLAAVARLRARIWRVTGGGAGILVLLANLRPEPFATLLLGWATLALVVLFAVERLARTARRRLERALADLSESAGTS